MPDARRTVDRYEIIREIGRGGMATVYLARQVDLGRNVALKELSAFHAADPMVAERFVRESRVAASFAHPNVVTVHDFFQEQGTPYIAMEHLERGSLRPYMKRLSVPQIAGVLEGVLAGLAHGEAAEVVHRDLKPENLLVTNDGGVKIADFGIAKAQRAMGGPALTATGSTVGTPTYMAPEQAMAQDIGPWTDLYSVGVMAYEMLSGRVPFPEEEAPMAVLLHHINDPVPPLRASDPSIDPALAAWVEGLLVKEPGERTRSAYAAWDELEEIVIDTAGPRWRRHARVVGKTETAATPDPLTPAPFESTHHTPTPTPKPAAAAQPQAAAPEPAEAVPTPAAPELAEAAPGPATAGEPAEAAESQGARTSGFVTFRGGRKAARSPAPPPAPEDASRPAVAPAPAPPEPPQAAPPPVSEKAAEPAAEQAGRGATEAPAARESPRAEALPGDEGLPATVQPRWRPSPPPVAEEATAMPVKERPVERRPTRVTPGRIALAAGLAVAVAAIAFLAGRSGGSTAEESPVRSLTAGPLELDYPARWREIAHAPELQASGIADGVVVGPASAGRRLVAGMTDATGPALLPEKLVESLESRPERPDAVRIGELEALRYSGLRPRRSPTAITVYAAPTTSGVATIACLAHPAELPAFERQCERVATTARLDEAEALPLGPNAGYAAALDTALTRLSDARRQGRRRLAAATTAGGQATAATSLQRAYGNTGKALAGLEPGPAEADAHVAIQAALERSRTAYSRLAETAARRERRAYTAAASAIKRSEANVQRAVERLKGLGYDVE